MPHVNNNLKLKALFEWLSFSIINFVLIFFIPALILSSIPCTQKLGPVIAIKVLAGLVLLVLFVLDFKYFRSITRIVKIITLTFIIFIIYILIMGSIINSSRSKGCDAMVKANMANARVLATLYQEKQGTYAGVCTSKDGILEQMQAAARAFNRKNIPEKGDFIYSQYGASSSTICHDNSMSWAAISSLRNPQTPNAGFCVDYTGAAREATSLPNGATTCP